MSFFTGFGVSSLMYYCLNVAFPPTGRFKHFKEVDLSDGDLPRSSGHEVWVGADPDEKSRVEEKGTRLEVVDSAGPV
jgi:NCS1 family nucleobase:cation symporter-1